MESHQRREVLENLAGKRSEIQRLTSPKAQQEAFQEEYKALVNFKSIPQKSKVLSLNPILDEDGLLRSDGKLRYADYLPFDARYPIILPRKSGVTRLIVKGVTMQWELITQRLCCQPDSGSCKVDRRFVTGKESAVNVGRGRQRLLNR